MEADNSNSLRRRAFDGAEATGVAALAGMPAPAQPTGVRRAGPAQHVRDDAVAAPAQTIASAHAVSRAACVKTAMAAALLCGAPASTWAQRNGDVSNGLNNQPTYGEVQSREQAGGVAPPPAQRQRETGTVDNLYRDLMGKERSDGMTNVPAGPNVAPAPAPARP
jgi:hypothetical protein